jgi:hypothetical protein
MASKIRQIENVLGAAGRQNKYRVTMSFPSGVSASTDLETIDVLAKSTSAPQKEIGLIELWNQGRKLPIPGDTTFDNTWTVSFYLSEDHSLRLDMLKWQDSADNFYENKHSGNPSAVFTDMKVEQLDSAGKATAQYTLHSCWPSVVGEATFDDSAENTPQEFEVSFTYSHWNSGSDDTPVYDPIPATKNDSALD